VTDTVLREDHPTDGPAFVLPRPMPLPRKSERAPALVITLDSAPVMAGTKRAANAEPDADDGIEALDGPPAPKRARTAPPPEDADMTPVPAAKPPPETPWKNRTLEENGLVLLDGPGQDLDDEEIIFVE
jgi:ubiquitin-like 1-activating enzyme E1 B